MVNLGMSARCTGYHLLEGLGVFHSLTGVLEWDRLQQQHSNDNNSNKVPAASNRLALILAAGAALSSMSHKGQRECTEAAATPAWPLN